MRRNIVPVEIAPDRTAPVSALTRLAKSLVVAQLKKVKHGRLRLIDGDQTQVFGERTAAGPFEITVRVHGPRFYSDAAFGGTVGAGEAYINGLWECSDLTGLVRLFVVNRDMMNDMDSGWSRISAPLLKFAHWLNRNDKSGSRRNIAAHYDLGNRFFELFLDETMLIPARFSSTPARRLPRPREPSSMPLAASSLSRPNTMCWKSAPAGAVSRSMRRNATAAASRRRRFRANSSTIRARADRARRLDGPRSH